LVGTRSITDHLRTDTLTTGEPFRLGAYCGHDCCVCCRTFAFAGFDVVHKKGHTNYAISLAATLVIEALVWDTRRTMPLSVLVDGFLGISDVCLSLPVVVGKGGITRVLQPEFSAEEAAAFRACADVVRAGIARSLQASAAATS
jgi:malate/lactate dehydrogenase